MRIFSLLLVGFALSAGSAFAQKWVQCATEDGYCTVNGTAVVQYGAGQQWARRNVTGGVRCSNSVFGDPAPGTRKSCYIQAADSTGMTGNPPKWVACAKDYSFCRFKGTRSVSYGVDKRWVYRTATDGINCVPESFGKDPAPGVQKTCYYDSANLRR